MSGPYTEADERCFRLSALIVNEGTATAKRLFDGEISTRYMGNLLAALNNPATQLIMQNYLSGWNGGRRIPKLLNQHQYDTLYPTPPQLPMSADFDLTLLMFLFRNLLGYPPPPVTGNWNGDPHVTDLSPSADLVRLRIMRNTVYAHINSTQITQAEFNTHWTYIKNALLGLDPSLTLVIDGYKDGDLSPSQYQKYEEYKTQIRQLMEHDLSDLQCMLHTLQNLVKQNDASLRTELSAIQESLGQITEAYPSPVLDLLKKLPADISQVIIQNLNTSVTEIVSCVRDEAKSLRAHASENTKYVKAHATHEGDSVRAHVTENTDHVEALITAGEETMKAHVTKESESVKAHATNVGDSVIKALRADINAKRSDDDQEYLQEVSSVLKSYYGKRYKKILFIPWDDTSKIRLDDIYVPLKLEENKDEQWKEVTGEKIKNIEELVLKHDRKDGNRETPVKLIIQGNPGSGKSTSCYKLVYDWAKSDSVLADKYELVILLKARDFSPHQDLFKKITDTIPDYNEENSKEVRDILRKKKILMIIDGYDELGDKRNQTQLNKLLDGTLYHKCDLVVTTRHWCTDQLEQFGCFDQIFTVCNFDDEDTKYYVSKFFTHYVKNENKDVVNKFISEVNKKHINNLLEQPLTCLFLCIVWQEKGGGEKLPKIRAQIYDQVIQVMKETYKKKVGDDFMDNTFNTLLNSLSKLAFEKRSILQFERKDMEDIYNIDVKLACAIGILVKADPPADGKKTLMVCDYYTFPHLTFQEFLGARYLYYSEVDLDKACEAMTTEDPYRYGYVYEFFFGHLSIELDKDITEDKLDRVNQMAYITHKHTLKVMGFLPIQQWEQSGCNGRFPWAVLSGLVIKAYFSKLRTRTVHGLCIDKLRIAHIVGGWDPLCDYFKSSSSQCQADLCFLSVCQKLAQSNTLKQLSLRHIRCKCDSKGSCLWNLLAVNKDLENVNIEGCFLNANDAMVMAPHLRNNNALVELCFYKMSLRGSMVHIMENLCETIRCISSELCHISSEEAKMMAPELTRLTLLTELHISGNPLGHSAIDIIENLSPAIQKLHMGWCDISSQHAEMMAPKLSRLTFLTKFDIRRNPLGHSAIYIIENLSHSIQELHMGHCDISSQHAERMARKLSRLTLLTEFGISGNPLGHSAIYIIENLSPSIQVLHISSCDISSQHADKMAPELRRLTLLTTFLISGNPLGHSAIDIIVNLSLSIQVLYMMDCGLSVEDVKSLAPNLQTLTALETLELWGNVSDWGEHCSCKELIKGYNSRVTVHL